MGLALCFPLNIIPLREYLIKSIEVRSKCAEFAKHSEHLEHLILVDFGTLLILFIVIITIIIDITARVARIGQPKPNVTLSTVTSGQIYNKLLLMVVESVLTTHNFAY